MIGAVETRELALLVICNGVATVNGVRARLAAAGFPRAKSTVTVAISTLHRQGYVRVYGVQGGTIWQATETGVDAAAAMRGRWRLAASIWNDPADAAGGLTIVPAL